METRYLVTDHFDGKHFFNPWGTNINKSFWDVIKWKLSGSAASWPETVENTARPQFVAAGQVVPLHVTYLGHATVYLQDGKRSILTDPQLSQRASPVSFAGPARVRKPGVEIADLPALDFVVVSHSHYDHMDLPTLKALDQKFHPQFIVPLGNARYLESEGIEKVVELDWWQSHESIELVPAQHWSARGILDRNEALWGGFVIRSGEKKIFFAGDTGYGPHFKMIRDKLGAMDLAILPIGGYEPRSFMKEQHMNPEDAVAAHTDLGAARGFGIHFETFQLTDEAIGEPRTRLAHALHAAKMDPQLFVLPEVGQTTVFRE